MRWLRRRLPRLAYKARGKAMKEMKTRKRLKADTVDNIIAAVWFVIVVGGVVSYNLWFK